MSTELDKAWEEINALGGYVAPNDEVGKGYDKAIGDALDIIERLGGRDPARQPNAPMPWINHD